MSHNNSLKESVMRLQAPAAGGFRPPGALGRRSSLAWEPLQGTPAQAHHNLASFRRTDSATRRSTRSASGVSHRSVRSQCAFNFIGPCATDWEPAMHAWHQTLH